MKADHVFKIIIFAMSFVLASYLTFLPLTQSQTIIPFAMAQTINVDTDHDMYPEIPGNYQYMEIKILPNSYFEIILEIEEEISGETLYIVFAADEDEGDVDVDGDTMTYYLGDDIYSSTKTSYDIYGDDSEDIELPGIWELFIMAWDESIDWDTYDWPAPGLDAGVNSMIKNIRIKSTDKVKVQYFEFYDNIDRLGSPHPASQDFDDYDDIGNEEADWDNNKSSTGTVSISTDGTLYLRNNNTDYYEQYGPYGPDEGYDPVCGCDGFTYFSEEEAERLGVSVDYPGECNIPRPTGLAESAWPCWRHDLRRTNCSPYTAAQTNTLKWSYKIGGEYDSPPVIGSDGSLYLVNNYKICSLNPQGELRWNHNYDTAYPYYSYPPYDLQYDTTMLLGADDTLRILLNNAIYAINTNGSLREIGLCKYFMAGLDSFTMGEDGMFYIFSYDSVYAVDPNYRLKWQFSSESIDSSSNAYYYYTNSFFPPSIAEDGTIYMSAVLSGLPSLFALDPNGNLKWSYQYEEDYPYYEDYYAYYPYGSGTFSPPSIGADGTLYIGSDDHCLYALDPNGSLKWQYQTGGTIFASPSIGPDGTLYAGSDDHWLYALNPNGSLKWRYQTGGTIFAPPSIGGDGTLYVGSDDHWLYALNPNGSLKWRYQTGGSICTSPSIGPDGTLYAASADGKVYAFGSVKTTAKSNIVRISGYDILKTGWIGPMWSYSGWLGGINYNMPYPVQSGNMTSPWTSPVWPGTTLTSRTSPIWYGSMGSLWGYPGWNGIITYSLQSPSWLENLGSNRMYTGWLEAFHLW